MPIETLRELMAVLDTCTGPAPPVHLLYALGGLSLYEIGVLCGCSKWLCIFLATK